MMAMIILITDDDDDDDDDDDSYNITTKATFTCLNASVARVWRYRNLIITIITITELNVAPYMVYRVCAVLQTLASASLSDLLHIKQPCLSVAQSRPKERAKTAYPFEF